MLDVPRNEIYSDEEAIDCDIDLERFNSGQDGTHLTQCTRCLHIYLPLLSSDNIGEK